jgi:predicted transcriptional regulator of viral defense system
MRPQRRTAERAIAEIANQAQGLVTRPELLAAGITPAEIKHRVRNGALLREYRGVFRVGHRAPSVETRYLAAVKACGRGAVLSGAAAGHLYGLLKAGPRVPAVTTRTERRVPGVETHRSRRLDSRDATTWRGVPVTSVARTLVDLAARLPVEDLARACHEADVRYAVGPAAVEEVLERLGNAPDAAKLRLILRGDVRVTLSKLESCFLDRLRAAGLPLPETNRRVGARRVDCRWPSARLTVELDSYRYHRTRHAWEQDREREREARARGDEFRRYTFSDVFESPTYMLADLQPLLQTRRPA